MEKIDFITEITQKLDFELIQISSDDELEEYNIIENDIKITLNENGKFNIFRDFCYSDYDGKLDNMIKELIQEETSKELKIAFCREAEVFYEDGMGCPYCAEFVGYSNNKYSVDFVEKFINVSDKVERESLHKHRVMEIISPIAVAKFGFVEFKDSMLINKDKTAVIFTAGLADIFIPEMDADDFGKVDCYYDGIKFFFGKSKDGQIITINKIYIETFKNLCMYFDVLDIEFLSDFKQFLFVKSGNLNMLVSAIKNEGKFEDEEYSILIKKVFELKQIKPNLSNIEMDFTHLSDTEFEDLCYDILVIMGFDDIHPIGKTNAPDGGKDIISTENLNTFFGTEQRKWIWQCKHAKRSLSRQDISEINDLLEENEAWGYGLFCSNSLTPSLITRLEMKKAKISGNIQYFGDKELASLLSSETKLITKYKLLGRKHNE